MRILLVLIGFIVPFLGFSQKTTVSGSVSEESGDPAIYANVILHTASDSSIYKVETSDLEGRFNFINVQSGEYFITISFVGFEDLVIQNVAVTDESYVELGALTLITSSVQLEAATVVAKRPLVEVKPDKTIFNVQGTINAVGDDGLALLRKAPGVLLDNNNNVSVLGRSGVLLYVDGKRLPLSGDDMTNYLRNLTADQIDRIDIISNPGAKYEAEGNAGIIDIRLKKNENHGTNGSLSSTFTKGKRERYNTNFNGNYRNGILNTYLMASFNGGVHYEDFYFRDFQNGLRLSRNTILDLDRKSINFRLGTDFFVAKNQTVGFLVNTSKEDRNAETRSRDTIGLNVVNAIPDSLLLAENNSTGTNKNSTFNVNYALDNGNQSLNVDLDYGTYSNSLYYFQPNTYYNAEETKVLSSRDSENDTPVDIDIYTFKTDYETNLGKGKFGVGVKLSQVKTNNGFLFYDVIELKRIFNERRSNIFDYDEKVYAGYLQYNTSLSEKWNLSSGLRVENTDATGDLRAFLPQLQEPPVELNYLNWFPSFGLTYQVSMGNTWSFNIGRRINRPDYNVLNPFEWQISEISLSKGNPNLQPEIVNNVELGYTLNWRYNFKLAYSITTNQITRLIGPDERDVRASFINWDNLAEQRILGLNISAPFTITDKWNSYFNINGFYLKNEADYGNGQTIDLETFTVNIFQQQTFTLPKGITAELSGWISSPGIWGGVFKYDWSWALNAGLQKKFFDDKLMVKLSVNDIFFQSWWSGFSEFGGLRSEGRGQQDSQNVSINLNYNFGNQKIKSRDRKTGLEEEADRIGG